MKAYNLSFTLICAECGALMVSEEYSKATPTRAIWRCINEKCTEHGKRFSQQLPQVSLTAVEPVGP